MNPPETKKDEVISVDGHAASGKGTVTKALSEVTGRPVVDSGGIYRTATLMLDREGIDHMNRAAAEAFIATNVSRIHVDGSLIQLDGETMGTLHIRTKRIDDRVSFVSKYPGVRSALIPLQRGQIRPGGIIMEGRDIGSTVFPKAQLKFFLTADVEKRAEWRFRQRQASDPAVTHDDVLKNLKIRDHEDENREDSPLVMPDGAVYINSTKKSLEQVIEEVTAAYRALGLGAAA